MRGMLVSLGRRSGAWLDACGAHPDVELVGFVDTEEAARDRLLAEHAAAGQRVFASPLAAYGLRARFMFSTISFSVSGRL